MNITQILQDFVDVAECAGAYRGVLDAGLRITNRRRDNETTSEFRRQKAEADPGVCRCGTHFKRCGTKTRCTPCQDVYARALRSAADRGRQRWTYTPKPKAELSMTKVAIRVRRHRAKRKLRLG